MGLCFQGPRQTRFAHFLKICVFHMTYLILVCGFYLAAATILESRLSLNTLIERAVMIFSLAAGLLVSSVQILSLATCLNVRGLILASIASIGLAWCIRLVRQKPASRVSWKNLLEDVNADLKAEKGRGFVLTLVLLAIGLMGLNAVAGVFMIPLGDPYHCDRLLFWRQNQSIEPAVTYNPWIVATSFAGEALGLPGFVFCKSGAMWLAVVWLAGVLSLGVVFSLARRLGCSHRAAAVAAMLPLGIPAWHQSFIEAGAAICLAGFWVGASALFLMRCGGTGELSGDRLSRLGCSVFCFVLGCATKNTTIFLAPVFLLALAICLRSLLASAKVMRTVTGWGMAAMLCSGALWNYAGNYVWFGNVSGPPAMHGLLLSSDQSISSVWTRCCRGAVLFLFDPIHLPRQHAKTYEALCQKTASLLGAKKELAEEVNDSSQFKAGSGFGLIGPLVILPAFIYGIVRFLRRGNQPGTEDTRSRRRDFFLLLVFAAGYAFLCHLFLKSQDIGVWRVMPAFPVLAAPVCGLLLEKGWQRTAVLTLTSLCALIVVSGNVVMMGNRFAADRLSPGLENNRAIQKFFSKIGKPPPWKVECRWGNEAPRQALIHEPYNGRETALLFLQRARHPAVIAFAGSFESQAYGFFGPDFSNRILPLVDCREPDRLLDPPANADYLVFPQNSAIDPATQTAWARQHGYRPFFRVDQQGACLFLSFEKIP
jgi:hypothetical protein